MIFNDRVDAALALFFMAVVVVVIAASAREWWMVAVNRKAPRVNEAPYVETRMDTVTA
jgi:carbon starvation protein